MIRRPVALLAAVAVLGGLATATAVLAQAPAPSSPPSQSQDMKGHGGMMMGPMDSDHMKQMTRMMENCNRMMERGQADKPNAPGARPPGK